jgi:hypothetical protein
MTSNQLQKLDPLRKIRTPRLRKTFSNGALFNVDLPFQTTIDTYDPHQKNQENNAVQLLVAEEDSELKLKRDEAVGRYSNELLKKFWRNKVRAVQFRRSASSNVRQN